jgi:hypothetical protein
MSTLTQVVLIILIIIYAPLITLWATNILLCGHWVIPYTFKTWFAVLCCGGLFKYS